MDELNKIKIEFENLLNKLNEVKMGDEYFNQVIKNMSVEELCKLQQQISDLIFRKHESICDGYKETIQDY